MSERHDNTARPEPPGGMGRWLESIHSEGLIEPAATPAATDLAKDSWEYLIEAWSEIELLLRDADGDD